VLVERCNHLMDSFRPVSDAGNGSHMLLFSGDDLPALLSAVKVWFVCLFMC
jgi:hypothetical protein